MKEIFNKTGNTLLLYKLAIVRFAFFSVNALCTAIMAALAGTSWAETDRQTHFLIVVAVLASWTNTLMAFFDKTTTAIARGQNPLIPDAGKSTSPFPSQPAAGG